VGERRTAESGALSAGRTTVRSMRAYKFLDADGCAPFTAFPWTPGEWVVSSGAAACRMGVHGCGPADLAHWLAASLWEVELDGEIVQTRHKVVGSRGRLVREVDGYRTAVRELAEVGAWRCRDRAVAALRTEGSAALVDRFAAAATLDELAVVGADVNESTFAGGAAALAADAAHFARHGLPAQAPFVAACSAGHVAGGPDGDQADYDEGYGAERAFQSAWLTERLALE
jgi:hypothetical protein